MANFFKDYQKQVREKREAEARAEREERERNRRLADYISGLKRGQKIRYSKYINVFTGEPIINEGYFIRDCGEDDGYIWFSDSKENAIKERGWTLRKCNLILPKRYV